MLVVDGLTIVFCNSNTMHVRIVDFIHLLGDVIEVVNKPMYATAVGLVVYGSKTSKKDRKFRIRDNNIFNRVIGRMKRWFRDVI